MRSRDGDQETQTRMMRQAGVKTGSALRRSHRKMAACLGSEGESKAEEVVGRVCQGPALCVGGNSGFFFFFQWKDCLTEQLEAGRAWKGRAGGGLSLRVSLGAQGGPVPGSGVEGADKGRQEPGPAGIPL